MRSVFEPPPVVAALLRPVESLQTGRSRPSPRSPRRL